MKTSKEKALELVDYFNSLLQSEITSIVYYRTPKQCAIKCVEEIIESKPIANSLEYYKDIIEEIKLL